MMTVIGRLLLPLDALGVLLGEKSSLAVFGQIKRVDEAKALERLVLAGQLVVGVLDVQRGDVVGQEHHLVGEELLAGTCAGRSRLGMRRMRFTMKLPVPVQGSRMTTSGSPSERPNSLLKHFVDAGAHEVDDGLRRVDDAVGVGHLDGVALEEALVDRVEKALLVARSRAEAAGGVLDGRVEVVQALRG